MTSEICGLRIEADVPLPQLRASQADPEVVITTGPPASVPSSPPAGRVLVDWRNDDDSIHWALSSHDRGRSFRIPGFVDFAVDSEIRNAVITPHDEDSARFTSILIGGTLAAVLLTLRGSHPIHASGVEVGGQCLAFAGESGAGKSGRFSLILDPPF